MYESIDQLGRQLQTTKWTDFLEWLLDYMHYMKENDYIIASAHLMSFKKLYF